MPKYRVAVNLTAIVPVEAESETAAAALLAATTPIIGDWRLCDLKISTQTLGPVGHDNLDVHDGKHEMQVELHDGGPRLHLTNAKMIG